MKTKILLSTLLAGLTIAVQAQTLSLERIYSDPALVGKAPKALKVAPDGKRVTFLQAKKTDYNRYDLWEYHIESGETRLLVDSDSLHSGVEKLSDEEKARRERMRVYGSGIMEYYWSKDGSALLFPLNGDVYYFKLANQQTKRLTHTEGFETDIRFSPKSNFVSYVREQNLFALNIATGEEIALTRQGKGPIKFGMAEFVAQEEMGRMTGYWWAPDESKIAFTRVDESPVAEIVRNEIYADEIKLFNQRYPLTGTDNVKIDLGVARLSDKAVQWVDLGRESDFYLPRVKWMQDSRHLTYQWQSRDQQTLVLNSVDTAQTEDWQSATRIQGSELLTETATTWINLHKDLRFLKDQKHFVWASERDGFKHLYLYKTDGSLVRQLTKGEWIVDKIERLDEKGGQLYFTGRKETPREKHLYRVSLTGGEIEKISQRAGFHNISFAKEGDVYIDRYSSSSSLPQVSVHDATGKKLTWLEENRVDSAHPYAPFSAAKVVPEFGQLKAEDGQALHYALYKPSKLTQSEKRPVIVFVYGGPHAQRVTDSWSRDQFYIQYLVSKGYLVFKLDNRGSYNRGKAFEDPIYKHLGKPEVADQIKGVEFLRTLPYVDSNRIGVYGHSYGGYMAQMLMFKAGEYFQAGVSGAPVTDWALYDTHYTERYLGHPESNAKGYEASAVFPYVEGLKGKLLIYHGMADDNVLFTHATKVFKVLQDQTKPFEMMTYPGSKHSMRGKKTRIHLYSTITDFFDRHFNMR